MDDLLVKTESPVQDIFDIQGFKDLLEDLKKSRGEMEDPGSLEDNIQE